MLIADELVDGHCGCRVRLVSPYEQFSIGVEGVCTADLPDRDVYAVMFDSSVGLPKEAAAGRTTWVRFDYEAKKMFEVVEEADALRN